MNKHRKLTGLLCLAIALCGAGCSEVFYDESATPSLYPHYLSVYPTNLSFFAYANSNNIEVVSPQSPWESELSADWVSISPSSGSGTNHEVTVSATENTKGDEARVAVGYIKSKQTGWNYQVPLTLKQLANTPKLEVSSSWVYFDGKAGTESITVDANVDWSLENNSDWITTRVSGNTITFSVSASPVAGDRYDFIYVKADKLSLTKTITVSQTEAEVNVDSRTLTFGNKESSYLLSVDAENDWTASTSDGWINVSPESGEVGTSQVSVSVTENTSKDARQGFVYFMVNGSERTKIKVNQEGVFITPAVEEMNFASTEQTQELVISSNTHWRAIPSADWLSVEVTSGEDNSVIKGNTVTVGNVKYEVNTAYGVEDGVLSITAADNNSVSSRTAYVHIYNNNNDIEKTVKIIQAGKSLSFSESQLLFSDVPGSLTLDVTTDGYWSIQSSEDWITVTPSSGTGSQTVTVTVTENEGRTERSGVLTVSMADITKEVNVVQTGKYFSVDSGELTLTSKGGNIRVSVSTNDTWQATVLDSPDWVSLTETEGSGDIKLNVVMADNPSIYRRSATVEFTTTSGYVIDLKVYQQPRYLKVSQSSLTFYYTAYTSSPITIETDGEFAVKKDGNWFNIAQQGNVLTVTAPENTQDYSRKGSITVYLTDLKEGELSITIDVSQYCKGGDYFRLNYGEDVNYDQTSGSASFNRTEYGNDNDLDKSVKTSFSITVIGYKEAGGLDKSNASGTSNMNNSGYGDDKNLDGTTGDSSMDKNGYGSDTNQDAGSNSSTNVDKSGYGEDKDQDSGSSSTSDVNKSGYGEDKNQDSGSSSSSDVNKSGYGEDKNHDNAGTSSSSVDKTGYKEDKNQDSGSNSNEDVNKEGYSEDKDLDKDSDK